MRKHEALDAARVAFESDILVVRQTLERLLVVVRLAHSDLLVAQRAKRGKKNAESRRYREVAKRGRILRRIPN